MNGKVNRWFWISGSLFGLFLLCAGAANAQDQAAVDEPQIIYDRQFTGGFSLHSQGFGGFAQMGKYRGVKKIVLLNLDVLIMKHEKEVKSYNPVYDDSRSYVYGKMNNFYVIRPMIGKRKVLTMKERKSGVQVAYTYLFGPSLGITKPVYLEIGYPAIPYDYLSVEKYDPERHFFDDIYGRASGLRGLDELSLIPGATFKFGLDFEYANVRDRLKGISVGAVLDVYPRQVPIMAEDYVESNRQYFLTFYLNLFFGRKYIQR